MTSTTISSPPGRSVRRICSKKIFQLDDVMERGVAEDDVVRRSGELDGIQIGGLEAHPQVFGFGFGSRMVEQCGVHIDTGDARTANAAGNDVSEHIVSGEVANPFVYPLFGSTEDFGDRLVTGAGRSGRTRKRVVKISV
jgi:hypothetical protein